VDRDNNGRGGLTFPGTSVRVEVSGGEDANVLGVEDRLRKAGEEFVWVFGEEGDGEGVNGELGFVGGEAEGQPGSSTHKEIGGFFLLFFFFFFYIIYSLLMYKKSHGAQAMAKAKPKIQNELIKEISGTYLFNWGPYRSQAHMRARN